jgi:hypothetical protein
LPTFSLSPPEAERRSNPGPRPVRLVPGCGDHLERPRPDRRELQANLDIVQQDRDCTTLRRWSLSRAWPVKFVAGEWDNEADEKVIESVTLTHEFFEMMQ